LPVTATGKDAGVETTVVIGLIAIVTGFALLNHTITAGGRPAVIAGIGGVAIAIVTALTRTHDAITAAGFLAGRQTGIVISLIAIVASLFAFMKQTITAAGGLAVAQTIIAVDCVAIVTGLKVGVAFTHIRAQNTITAKCR
tara:strand:+ start:363 stop:785 length:423 start_codon:yes stop_codon:yes gene_type:complete